MLTPVGLLLVALVAVSAAVGSHDLLHSNTASDSSASDDAAPFLPSHVKRSAAVDAVPLIDELTLAPGLPVPESQPELLTLEQRRPDMIKQPAGYPQQPLQVPPVRRRENTGHGGMPFDADSKLDLRRDHTWLLLNRTAAGSADFRAPVPRVIHLTYMSRSRVPAKVWRNLDEHAAGFEHRFYDDDAIVAVLREHFHPDVAAAFHSLRLGAHKADLARLALLWLYGGVYLDIRDNEI